MVKKSNSFDFAIVGGGIVGLSCAFKLQVEYPKLNIVVFEKEQTLAAHQTGRNSGVIHSGLYYRPGSFRAKNCVNGRKQLVEFAKKYNIKHDVCGKVVVAVNQDEEERLDKICKTGKANGLEGIEKIDAVRLKEIEPYVEGIAALWVPESGIIDFVGVTNKLAELITDINPNSKIIYSCEVKSFDDGGLINTTKGQYKSDIKIFCGGLFSDRLAKKDKVHSVTIGNFRMANNYLKRMVKINPTDPYIFEKHISQILATTNRKILESKMDEVKEKISEFVDESKIFVN